MWDQCLLPQLTLSGPTHIERAAVHFHGVEIWMWCVLHRLMCLNDWSPGAIAIWEGFEAFRSWNPDGGSRSLWVGTVVNSLVPLLFSLYFLTMWHSGLILMSSSLWWILFFWKYKPGWTLPLYIALDRAFYHRKTGETKECSNSRPHYTDTEDALRQKEEILHKKNVQRGNAQSKWTLEHSKTHKIRASLLSHPSGLRGRIHIQTYTSHLLRDSPWTLRSPTSPVLLLRWQSNLSQNSGECS